MVSNLFIAVVFIFINLFIFISFFHSKTGAGDAFIGALAYFFAKFPEASLLQKMSASVSIATHSVQSMGTQSSYVNFPKIDPTAKGFKFNLL